MLDIRLIDLRELVRDISSSLAVGLIGRRSRGIQNSSMSIVCTNRPLVSESMEKIMINWEGLNFVGGDR